MNIEVPFSINPVEFFTRWIIAYFVEIGAYFVYWGVLLVNKLIHGVADGAEVMISLLPTATLPTVTSLANLPDAEWLSLLNFFTPMDTLVICIGFWASSEITYFGVAPVLRWFKLVRG